MKSIGSVYKIGNGPSSSHTVGPYNAAQAFRARFPDADTCQVTLFGSLALVGEGHGTENAIRSALPNASITVDTMTSDLPHPNTMRFTALKDGNELGSLRIFSIGGGSIQIEGEVSADEADVYPQKDLSEILRDVKDSSLTLAAWIRRMEGPSLQKALEEVWRAMQDAVVRGRQSSCLKGAAITKARMSP